MMLGLVLIAALLLFDGSAVGELQPRRTRSVYVDRHAGRGAAAGAYLSR